MSKIQKSRLAVDGNHVHLSMPFSKVDKENRLVSGWATLDNVDTQGDVVLAEASAKAFSRARGNIREMHQPIAAGRIVDFREEEYFDTTDNTFYRGIYVTAYVSEGAEDTWKKVLDGTLSGFSIGGEINEASNEFVKEYNTTVRYIHDYDLTELSLVDNPANQLANVFSITKSASGGLMVKGMAMETHIENVFICKMDDTVIVKDSASENCPECGTKMENAGWFESGEHRVEKVRDIVSKFWNPSESEVAPISDSEGGVEMGPENVEKSQKPEDVDPEVPEVEEVSETDETEDETEVEAADVTETDETEEAEAADVDEVEDDEDVIAKRIDELHEAVKDSLEKTKTETAERVTELEKKIEEAADSFLSKANEIESKMGELVQSIETQKARVADMEARVEKMNSSDAMKKSADLEKSVEKSVQSETSWNGAFSGRRSSFSVDDLM